MPDALESKYWDKDGNHEFSKRFRQEKRTFGCLEDAKEYCVENGYNGFIEHFGFGKSSYTFTSATYDEWQNGKSLQMKKHIHIFKRDVFEQDSGAREITVPTLSAVKDQGYRFQDALEALGKFAAKRALSGLTFGLSDVAELLSVANDINNIRQTLQDAGIDSDVMAKAIDKYKEYLRAIGKGYALCTRNYYPGCETDDDNEAPDELEFPDPDDFNLNDEIQDRAEDFINGALSGKKEKTKMAPAPEAGRYYLLQNVETSKYLTALQTVGKTCITDADAQCSAAHWLLVPADGDATVFAFYNRCYPSWMELAGASKSPGAFLNFTKFNVSGNQLPCQFQLWQTSNNDYVIMNRHSKLPVGVSDVKRNNVVQMENPKRPSNQWRFLPL